MTPAFTLIVVLMNVSYGSARPVAVRVPDISEKTCVDLLSSYQSNDKIMVLTGNCVPQVSKSE